MRFGWNQLEKTWTGCFSFAVATLLCGLVPFSNGAAAAQDQVAQVALGEGAEPLSKQDSSKKDGEDEKWISLFNGKDLEGWTPKIRYHDLGENHANTFRVEDGILKVGYEGYEKFNETFGHLFYKDSFSHYRIRVEYRFVGKQCEGGPGWATRNSGVMVHGEQPETMGKDQDFPASIEVQLLGGDGIHDRTTANLCTPGTNVVFGKELVERHCTSSTSKTYHGEGWVTVEIEVHGDEVIRHLVDGKVVLEYQQPQLDPKDGHAKTLIEKAGGEKLLKVGSISLQSESHPIEFRKVELLDLSK
jgi:beta-glucanase (GH16 family)